MVAMMSEMVERVARALCRHGGEDPDASSGAVYQMASGKMEFIDGEKYPRWNDFVTEARTAIEAMREPTSAMEKAGFETSKPPFGFALVGVGAAPCWTNMIDEALR